MLSPLTKAQVHFQLGEEIGAEGKNSRVFKAHDPQLNATLVIKRIEKNRLGGLAEFYVEANQLYMSSHSNVVPIHYACEDDDHINLAMPYFSRGSLKALMATRRLSVREIIVFATQFLSGLQHIHSKRLIHFDIKPDNILITDRGEAVLSDFGLAKAMANTGQAEQDRFYGSMSPPERFGANKFTNRFDIYQVGLTLYRMCVGDDDFYGQYSAFVQNGDVDMDLFRHAVVNGQFPDRVNFPEYVPKKLIETICKCMKIDPGQRFGAAVEVVNELADIDGEMLDWQYQIAPGERRWTKVVGESTLTLVVDAAGRSLATRTGPSGRTSRITEFCLEPISRKQIRSFLGNY